MNDRNDRSDRNERNRRGTPAVPCCPVCDSEAAAEAEAAAASAADTAVERRQTERRRASEFSEPICVSANQIYDSCRDRDCVSDARVYLTAHDQELLEDAINVKLKRAEIIWVYTNVEPLSFNNGYFSIDLKFFVRTTLELFTGVCNPTVVYGLTTFDKRVILFGSEGNSKVFKSTPSSCGCETPAIWQNTCMPTVVIETVEPVALSASIEEPRCGCCDTECGCGRNMFPENICGCFDDDLVVADNIRHVNVSYGLFSIIRLERDTQLLIDAIDFCIPTQECASATEDRPCSLFNDIRFPIDEFFPSQKPREHRKSDGCGCCD